MFKKIKNNLKKRIITPDLKKSIDETVGFIQKEKILKFRINIEEFFNDKFIKLNLQIMIFLISLITILFLIINYSKPPFLQSSPLFILSGSLEMISWIYFALFILLSNEQINKRINNNLFNNKINKKYQFFWFLTISILILLSLLLPGINYIYLFSLFFGFFLITGMSFISIIYFVYEFLIYIHEKNMQSKYALYSREKFDMMLSIFSILIFFIIFLYILEPAQNVYNLIYFNFDIKTSLDFGITVIKGLFWIVLILSLVFILQPFLLKKFYRLWSTPALMPLVFLGGGLSILYYYKAIESLSFEIGNFIEPITTQLSFSSIPYTLSYIIFSLILLFTGILSTIYKKYKNQTSAKIFIIWILTIILVEITGVINYISINEEILTPGAMGQKIVLLYGWPIIPVFLFILIYINSGKIICLHCKKIQWDYKKCIECGRKTLKSNKIKIKHKEILEKKDIQQKPNFFKYIFIIFGILILILTLSAINTHQFFRNEHLFLIIISILFIISGSGKININDLLEKMKNILSDSAKSIHKGFSKIKLFYKKLIRKIKKLAKTILIYFIWSVFWLIFLLIINYLIGLATIIWNGINIALFIVIILLLKDILFDFILEKTGILTGWKSWYPWFEHLPLAFCLIIFPIVIPDIGFSVSIIAIFDIIIDAYQDIQYRKI